MNKVALKPRSLLATNTSLIACSSALLFALGCAPQGGDIDTSPTEAMIFNPGNNHNFADNNGTVEINALSSVDVCYTIDGSTPVIENGNCSGSTAELLSGNSIYLDCGDNTDPQVFKQIQLAYTWELIDRSRSATYILDCTPPPADNDGDGIPNDFDNCPEDYNPGQEDSDGNGIGDACQNDAAPDADGDGRPDSSDNCPNVWNVKQGDADNDGLGNVCDPTPEGEPQLAWANHAMLSDWSEWEQDLRCELNYKRNGNNNDCSDPGGLDAIGVVQVTCPNGGTARWENKISGLGADTTFDYTDCSHTIANGRTLTVNGRISGWFNSGGSASDNAGDFTISGDWTGRIIDNIDIVNRVKARGYYTVACTNDPVADENCAPANLAVRFDAPAPYSCNGGICPEATQPLEDSDNDGIPNKYDNCPYVANPDQANQDFDEYGDVCDDSTDSIDDTDNDGVNDPIDNCPLVPNSDQTDTDNDGLGDVCDSTPNFKDEDEDGIESDNDNCRFTPNPSQNDWNNNGIGDACEDSDNDNVMDDVDNCVADSNHDQADADNDGIGDVCDEPAYFLIKVDNNDSCMSVNGSDQVVFAGCNNADRNQRWEALPMSTDTNFGFRNLGQNKCLKAITSWGVPYANVDTCANLSQAFQWNLRDDGTDQTNFPYQFSSMQVNFCIYRNDSNRAAGSLGNCGLISKDRRSMGLYPEGDLSGSSARLY